MDRTGVRFLLGDRVETLSGIDPTMTVLQWLRANRRVGTKEGCAEGDCGACTVVLGILDGDRIRYRAVNACILFVPMLDGRQLVTVEDLRQPDGALHPVQQAMVDAHASQCGFCTPGFVMSLFALAHGDAAPDRETVCDAIAGNLCRCTGYRPILEAAAMLRGGGAASGPADSAADRFGAAATVAQLRAIERPTMLAVEGAGRRYFAPRSTAELAGLLAAHPDACLLAGGTDVGLWVTKQHRSLDVVVDLGRVAELRTMRETATHLEIGAGVTYSDLLPAIEGHFPSFGRLLRRLGAAQIRNAGTMGGNVANGSPIGDSMPALIALGATLVLNAGGTRRELPLEDYYLAYRTTALRPGEFVETVRVPIHVAGRQFATWKVSKRLEQDIAAVAAGFAVVVENGRVAACRAAYGGMAAVPKRATQVEQALLGRPWTLHGVTAAAAALDRDFQPIDDMRASAGYRALVARNLLVRFYLEQTGQGEDLDRVGHG